MLTGARFTGEDGGAPVIAIKPEEVVADRALRPYVNLPGPVGLQQLCDSGALQRIGERRYRILKKIQIPAGVDWAFKFLLPPGVEPPDRNAFGGGQVTREDTGEWVRF
jgi:hypothetical protein